MTPDTASWWTPHRFDVGDVRRWRVGPATVTAERLAREWRIAVASSDDALERALTVAEPVAEPPSEEAPVDGPDASGRFSFGTTPATLALEPRLADRDVIVRPAEPLTVPAGESTLLYVSTPLWIAVATRDPRHVLLEAPCFRPSDTWFGPSTVDGELCYASRTTARLDLDDVPVRPHRAITAVRIRNQAKDPLALERLDVPVEILPLLAGRRGLWTPQLVLTRGEGAEGAEVHVDARPPKEAGAVVRVAEPRRRPDGALSLRSFGRWLGLGPDS